MIKSTTAELEALMEETKAKTGFNYTKICDKLNTSYSNMRAYIRKGIIPKKILLQISDLIENMNPLEEYTIERLLTEVRNRGFKVTLEDKAILGIQTQVYLKDGSKCPFLIRSYNPITKIAEIYEATFDLENGCTTKMKDGLPVIKEVYLEGSWI